MSLNFGKVVTVNLRFQNLNVEYYVFIFQLYSYTLSIETAETNVFHHIKYGRIQVFTDAYPAILFLYGRIRVGGNPYSRMFHAVFANMYVHQSPNFEKMLRATISSF